MPCCKRPDSLLRRRLLLAGGALALAAWRRPAWADVPRIAQAELIAVAEGYMLDAEIEFELGTRLEEAVMRGVPLYFLLEFRIERERLYWFDERVVEQTLQYRLSYHAITRRYRLAYGALHQNFETLDEALRVLRRVRSWQVAGRRTLKPDERYTASLRFSLDTSQLPRPFQVTVIGSREWSLDTDWLHWSVSAMPLPEERE